jgi:iron complex transport system ATP-binding protein
MLEFRNVSFAYGRPVLRDISFKLQSGCVTCVLSPNAGGKSTLLGLAAGLLKPQAGEILLAGRDVQNLKPKQRARLAALLPQWNAVPELTVYELAAHGRYPHLSARHVLSAKDKESIEHALAITGAAEFRHRRLAELSGGQRQKAALSMAVAQDTPLLLLDEPTTYWDIRVQLDLMETLQGLARSGKTILLAIHDIPLALRFCQRALVLHEGRLIYDGAAHGLQSSGAIEQAFGVKGIERSAVYAS